MKQCLNVVFVMSERDVAFNDPEDRGHKLTLAIAPFQIADTRSSLINRYKVTDEGTYERPKCNGPEGHWSL